MCSVKENGHCFRGHFSRDFRDRCNEISNVAEKYFRSGQNSRVEILSNILYISFNNVFLT